MRLGSQFDPVTIEEGRSSFFSAPKSTTDPRIIEGDRVRSEIREGLLTLLYVFWRTRYNDPESWSRVWIAGSALTQQYDEADLMDLDVLIGVDMTAFRAANPEFRGASQFEIQSMFNAEFRQHLQPRTTNWLGQFEVTFYVNADATDIRAINPYAAYDLTRDEWTVRPPRLEAEHDPEAALSPDERRALESVDQRAQELVDAWNEALASYQATSPGSPQHHNASTRMRQTASQAEALFDQIHQERKGAFSFTGTGYADFRNVRWQHGKKTGTLYALKRLRDLSRNLREGKIGPIESAQDVLTKRWVRDS